VGGLAHEEKEGTNQKVTEFFWGEDTFLLGGGYPLRRKGKKKFGERKGWNNWQESALQ